MTCTSCHISIWNDFLVPFFSLYRSASAQNALEFSHLFHITSETVSRFQTILHHFLTDHKWFEREREKKTTFRHVIMLSYQKPAQNTMIDSSHFASSNSVTITIPFWPRECVYTIRSFRILYFIDAKNKAVNNLEWKFVSRMFEKQCITLLCTYQFNVCVCVSVSVYLYMCTQMD